MRGDVRRRQTPGAKQVRFPWSKVKGFRALSCSDGTIKVEPDYFHKLPGLLTRMQVARWVEHRLAKQKYVLRSKKAMG